MLGASNLSSTKISAAIREIKALDDEKVLTSDFNTYKQEVTQALTDLETSLSTDIDNEVTALDTKIDNTKLDLESSITTLDDAKVDKNQGIANAGKHLIVNNEGNVSLETLDLSGYVESITSDYNLVDNTDTQNPKILQDTTKLDKNFSDKYLRTIGIEANTNQGVLKASTRNVSDSSDITNTIDIVGTNGIAISSAYNNNTLNDTITINASALDNRISALEDDKLDKIALANKVYGTDDDGEQTSYDITAFGAVDTVNNITADANKNITIDAYGIPFNEEDIGTEDEISIAEKINQLEENIPNTFVKINADINSAKSASTVEQFVTAMGGADNITKIKEAVYNNVPLLFYNDHVWGPPSEPGGENITYYVYKSSLNYTPGGGKETGSIILLLASHLEPYSNIKYYPNGLVFINMRIELDNGEVDSFILYESDPTVDTILINYTIDNLTTESTEQEILNVIDLNALNILYDNLSKLEGSTNLKYAPKYAFRNSHDLFGGENTLSLLGVTYDNENYPLDVNFYVEYTKKSNTYVKIRFRKVSGSWLLVSKDEIDLTQSALTTRVDTLETTVTTAVSDINDDISDLSSNLNTEITNRTDADSTLQDNIDIVQTTLENSKVDKVNTASKIYGTDENGDQIVYDINDFGKVDTVNNISPDSNKNITLTAQNIKLRPNGSSIYDTYAYGLISRITQDVSTKTISTTKLTINGSGGASFSSDLNINISDSNTIQTTWSYDSNRNKLTITPEIIATAISYTNTGTGLTSTTMQNAISELDTNKLDRISTSSKIYGTDASGNQTTYNLSDFGAVETVNNIGVDAGTKNITLYASQIQMSSSNINSIYNNFNESYVQSIGFIVDTNDTNKIKLSMNSKNLSTLDSTTGYTGYIASTTNALTIDLDGNANLKFTVNPENIAYDNTNTDLTSRTMQNAITEIADEVDTLNTTVASMQPTIQYTQNTQYSTGQLVWVERDDNITLMARVKRDFLSDSQALGNVQSFIRDYTLGNLSIIGIPLDWDEFTSDYDETMEVLNDVDEEPDTYEGLGATEEEVEAVLDDILGE